MRTFVAERMLSAFECSAARPSRRRGRARKEVLVSVDNSSTGVSARRHSANQGLPSVGSRHRGVFFLAEKSTGTRHSFSMGSEFDLENL